MTITSRSSRIRGDRSQTRLLLSSVALVAIVSATSTACRSAEPPAEAATPATARRVDVPALTVAVGDLESTLQISGNLMPQTRVAIMATLPGTLSRVAIVDRLDVEDADAADVEALGAEGMEISVPARGSVRPVLRDMLKHLCSAVSYGGADSLGDLRTMFLDDPTRYVIRLTESARRESFDR